MGWRSRGDLEKDEVEIGLAFFSLERRGEMKVSSGTTSSSCDSLRRGDCTVFEFTSVLYSVSVVGKGAASSASTVAIAVVSCALRARRGGA